MKKWAVILTGAVLACGLSTAGAERKPSVMLKVSRKMHTDRAVKESGGRRSSGRRTETAESQRVWSGTRTVSSTASMEITIDLWNTDAAEREYEVKWYYIADPKESGEQDYVFEKGSEKRTLKPREKQTITHESGSLTEVKSSGSKSTTKSGGKLVGFIVVVYHGEDVVASDASSWNLKRLMQNPATRRAFLESETL